MIVVRMLMSVGKYNAGETAGFDRITARKMVQRKIAEFYDPNPPVTNEGADPSTVEATSPSPPSSPSIPTTNPELLEKKKKKEKKAVSAFDRAKQYVTKNGE